MNRQIAHPADPILIVEDDDVFRERLVRALAQRGLRVQGAADGAEAAAVAAELRPARAVIDLRMPGEWGLQVLEQLKTLHPDLEVVMLTGYGSIATAKEAMRLGAVDYLIKPADADEILAAFDPPPERKLAPEDVPVAAPSLARTEWEHIQRILTDCGGNVSQAARVLGIHRRSLQRKLAKYPPPEAAPGDEPQAD